MDGDVGVPVAFGGEPLVAPVVCALEGLLTSVYFAVAFQIRDLVMHKIRCRAQYLGEGFATAGVHALVGLLAGVDPHVLLERGLLAERLATACVRAREVSDKIIKGYHVHGVLMARDDAWPYEGTYSVSKSDERAVFLPLPRFLLTPVN